MQETLGQKETMTAILEKMDMEEVGKLNKMENRKSDRRGYNNQKRHCYICEEEGGKFDSHDTKYCWKRHENKKKHKYSKAKVRVVRLSDSESEPNDTEEDIRKIVQKIKMKSRQSKDKTTSEDSD